MKPFLSVSWSVWVFVRAVGYVTNTLPNTKHTSDATQKKGLTRDGFSLL